MLIQDDRIAFSLVIATADDQIKGINLAQSSVAIILAKAQKLDTANSNLFGPVNSLVNNYQAEYAMLDGNVRTTILDQDVQDAANKKLQNYFFPNDTSVSVPSLVTARNVWTKFPPYGLTYAIGKNYIEIFPSTATKEGDLITIAKNLITSASANQDIENTTGQTCGVSGTCSIPSYTTQATCTAAAGTWTLGPDLIANSAPIQTLKSNLITAVQNLKAFLVLEVANIVTNDPLIANQTQNNAAIANINNVILPALNLWLAYADFNTAHGKTTCVGFYAYNSNLLAPTKLHSNQLTALLTALNNRTTSITSRLAQIFNILGTVAQDVSTGVTTYSGLYGKRYSFLSLRLNVIGGSLSQLVGLQASSDAQTAVKNNIASTKATYYSILPTSVLAASGNNTNTISVIDNSFLNVGDTVFIYAEGQPEIQRAVASINGNLIALNDVVPASYNPRQKARVYKDIS